MNPAARNPLLGLESVIAETLRRAGVSARLAASTAAHAVRGWCANFGGVTVYLPRGHEERIAKRDARIVQEFDGTNAVDLARCYGLSESRIRQIIRRERAAAASRGAVAASDRRAKRTRAGGEAR